MKVGELVTVTLGSVIVYGVNPGNDNSSHEALDSARAICKWRSEYLDYAIVDRNDGLVICRREALRLSDDGVHAYGNGVHFRNASAGYPGTGVSVSARILDAFGFGDYRVIFEQIRHGDEGAHFHFEKLQSGEVVSTPRSRYMALVLK